MTDSRLRLLIVDREKLLIELLGRALPADLVEVLSAASCDEAKTLMAMEPMDMLLVNPGCPGATEWMAGVKASNRIDVVMALTESPEQEAAAVAGGMEVVRKNGGMADLLQVMELKLNIPLVTPGARRVLVVDDDPGVLAFTRSCLITGGYFVHLAADGVEALEVLDRQPDISVVLLDIMMPEKGGIDTLCEIEKRKGHPAVIMMTGLCDAAIAEIAIRAGALDYITKPLDEGKVMSAVDAAVAHIEYAR